MDLRSVIPACVAAAALVACNGSDEPDAIRTGSVPTPTDRVAVAAPEQGGFTAFDRWPKACALFTEADVRAAFPGITKVAQSSISYQLDVSDGAFGRPTRQTVVDGTCSYRFWFNRDEKSEYADSRSNLLNVTVRLAGDPEIVGLNYKPGERGSAAHPKGHSSRGYVENELLPAFAQVVATRLS